MKSQISIRGERDRERERAKAKDKELWIRKKEWCVVGGGWWMRMREDDMSLY